MNMIPDYQTLMLPLLKFSDDQEEHSIGDAIQYLAKSFNLTEEELNEWLPSKSQKLFYNRVYWAKAYLKMAGLIENTRRSHFKITQQGLETLKENLESINVKYLRKFPQFISSIEGGKKVDAKEEITNITNNASS